MAPSKLTKEFVSQRTLELKNTRVLGSNSKSKKNLQLPRPPKSKEKKRGSNETRYRPNKRSAAKKFTIYEASTDRRESLEHNHRFEEPADQKHSDHQKQNRVQH